MYVIKDELDHFEEKKYPNFVVKKSQIGYIFSGSGIRTGQKVPDPTGSDRTDPDPQKRNNRTIFE
jgi:hypothetical protein